ncbi:Exocyst complex protein Exo70 [Macleaya cordata]|uniref:Exocyst subunit Exo70 family protein n=1 Tax=Macleaya cordata TaxID=56857 RepID=A0A200QGP5_MACCD|nr:Exocyst complex protein Exo70 [Macleaya cordata]
MEKNPPEKSGSFACRSSDHLIINNNNNANNPEPTTTPTVAEQQIPSSSPHQSTDVDPKPEESPTLNNNNNNNNNEDNISQEELLADSENKTEEEDSSDLASNITRLSEDIDRFRTLLSSTTVDDQNPPPNPPEIPVSIENFVKFVEADILNQDSSKEPEKWLQDSDEGPSLLQSIDRIWKLTNSLGDFHFDPQYAASLNRTGTVLQKAMSFLEEEFRALLEDSRSCDTEPIVTNPKTKKQGSFSDHDRCTLPEPGSSGDVKFPGYTPEVVSNLNRIATAMISAGYETECCQVYSITRRNVFDESLNKLGFEKISIDDVQKMQWESLESEIATWIKTFKRCITVYFAGERKLCEAVFSDFPPVSASLFSNLTRSVIIQLLNFAEAVAMTKRSAEKLFKFLDMYETLRDLIPAMDEIFFDESSAELKSEISSARSRLGEAVVSIFCDLENSIKSDTGRTPVPGGAVHPLTRYTMNYLKYACEYKDTLEQVFLEHKKIDNNSDAESDTPNHNSQTVQTSPFAMQLMNVMDLLDANLETKAKLYKDLSLSYIFLMNNGRYIMQKIKGSVEIYHLMGDTWSRKRSSDLRQYHKNYQRETWGKVLACLRDEGLQVNGKVSKPVLKERFKTFNSIFEEIHKAQSSWVVSDEQLQSELRVSISAVMIPAYRSFLARFRQYLDSGRQSEKYIKYGPEDIETSIDELFDGNPASMVRRRT